MTCSDPAVSYDNDATGQISSSAFSSSSSSSESLARALFLSSSSSLLARTDQVFLRTPPRRSLILDPEARRRHRLEARERLADILDQAIQIADCILETDFRSNDDDVNEPDGDVSMTEWGNSSSSSQFSFSSTNTSRESRRSPPSRQ